MQKKGEQKRTKDQCRPLSRQTKSRTSDGYSREEQEERGTEEIRTEQRASNHRIKVGLIGVGKLYCKEMC